LGFKGEQLPPKPTVHRVNSAAYPPPNTVRITCHNMLSDTKTPTAARQYFIVRLASNTLKNTPYTIIAEIEGV
jgi:hypothetical protein